MPSNESQRCYFLTFDTEKIDQVRSVYIVTASIDAILILPTTILNVLLIISLYRSAEIRKPSMKLLFSLAMSDVLVGLAMEPTFLAKKIAEFTHEFSLYCKLGPSNYVVGGALGCVSFLTLTIIAIDRYLVVHTGTKYRYLVTNRRVVVIIPAVWLASFILFSSQFYTARSLYFKVAAAVTITCVAIASVCYIKCFFTLRNQKRLINVLSEGAAKQKATNIYIYRKSMCTMAYVFIAFNICYLPYICTTLSTSLLGESPITWGAESASALIIYSNSLINPVILFWRMKEISTAVAKTMASFRSTVQSSHINPQNRNTSKDKDTTAI